MLLLRSRFAGRSPPTGIRQNQAANPEDDGRNFWLVGVVGVIWAEHISNLRRAKPANAVPNSATPLSARRHTLRRLHPPRDHNQPDHPCEVQDLRQHDCDRVRS